MQSSLFVLPPPTEAALGRWERERRVTARLSTGAPHRAEGRAVLVAENS